MDTDPSSTTRICDFISFKDDFFYFFFWLGLDEAAMSGEVIIISIES